MIAYYVMGEWLAGFAYRTGIHPLVFVFSAALLIAVAFVTIALQSYRSAQANPAAMMRYE
jgi:putative ABC transport system permease protein